MKCDPKSPSLAAVVPSWAQTPEITFLRPLEASLRDGSSAISASLKLALLRVDEAATILNVSSKTIRRLTARGDLRVVRIGRLVRVPSSEIDRLMAAGCPSGGNFGDGGDHD